MRIRIEKAAFVISLAALSFLYGSLSSKRGWFPDFYVVSAIEQARSIKDSRSPDGLLPHVYNREGVQVPQPQESQPGITLVSSFWKKGGTWKPGLRLIGKEGQVLHEWLLDRKRLFPDSLGLYRRDPEKAIIHGSHLLPSGDVVVNLEYVGTVRLDACSQLQWRLPARGHHSIARATDGTFWIPGVSQKPYARSEEFPQGYPGLPDPVWLDKALHVSVDGEIIEKINLLDIVYENDLERYIPKMRKNPGTDIIHVNDIEPLSPSKAESYPLFEQGDLLFSLRHVDLVFVFDPDTGKAKWHASNPFIGQHDPDFLGKGWIGVFDNNEDYTSRRTMLGGSRIVAVQPHTDSMKILFPTQYSKPFYTARQGKWQKLENGNMLLTETEAGRVVEVAPDGRTVWEYVRAPYDSRVPTVKGATRHNLSREEVASWPCSSID